MSVADVRRWSAQLMSPADVRHGATPTLPAAGAASLTPLGAAQRVRQGTDMCAEMRCLGYSRGYSSRAGGVTPRAAHHPCTSVRTARSTRSTPPSDRLQTSTRHWCCPATRSRRCSSTPRHPAVPPTTTCACSGSGQPTADEHHHGQQQHPAPETTAQAQVDTAITAKHD